MPITLQLSLRRYGLFAFNGHTILYFDDSYLNSFKTSFQSWLTDVFLKVHKISVSQRTIGHRLSSDGIVLYTLHRTFRSFRVFKHCII